MSDLAPRPRSVTEIVDAAFQLYRRNPVQLMMVTAIIYVPLLVLQVAANAAMGISALPKFGNLMRPSDPAGAAQLQAQLHAGAPSGHQLLVTFGLAIVALFVYGLVDAALSRIGSELYFDRECDAWDALRAVRGRLGTLLGATALRWVAVFIGCIFLGVGGVYVYVRYFCVMQVPMIEGAGAVNSFHRSTALSRGLKWHILGTLLLAYLVLALISWGATGTALMLQSGILLQGISAVVVTVIYPFLALTQVVLYYDSRIRLEGYDIEIMAAMGSPPLPLPVTAVSL